MNDLPVKPGLEGYALPRKCPTFVFTSSVILFCSHFEQAQAQGSDYDFVKYNVFLGSNCEPQSKMSTPCKSKINILSTYLPISGNRKAVD
jgi:hypothetical protein